jgi:hypothetical protein
VLAGAQPRPLGVGSDADFVYWACGGLFPDGASTIQKIAK